MTEPPAHRDDAAEVRVVVVGPLENNVYVVVCRRTGEAAIIDAADEADRVLAAAADVRVGYILTTHGHADHVGAAAEVAAALDVPIRIHPADAAMARLTQFDPIEPSETVVVGDLRLEAVHTPGHTPGSTCFLLDDLLFSGDTLFPGGPGATGDPERFREIMTSLEARLFVLPDHTRVLPGHGPDTTIGTERPSLPEWWRRGY